MAERLSDDINAPVSAKDTTDAAASAFPYAEDGAGNAVPVDEDARETSVGGFADAEEPSDGVDGGAYSDEAAEPYDEERPHRVEIVTEAVVHERRLPRSSEKSATFETSETLTGEPGLSDAEYISGGRPVIHYHLSDYDGPLDLLLELIKEAKIDIEDIFISDVTR